MADPLAVAGNIARVHTSHPRRGPRTFLGGAAWHITLAAARAGLAAVPVSVVGPDLATDVQQHASDRLVLDHVRTEPGPSAQFALRYDTRERLIGVDSQVGVAAHLTAHVLNLLPRFRRWHLCCRRPLDPAAVLDQLRQDPHAEATVDFFAPSAKEMIAAVAAALPATSGVFVNAAEHALLTDVIAPDRLAFLVVTDGPRQVSSYRYGVVTATITPPAIIVDDPTGAGDTLVGHLLAARSAGLTDAGALHRAVAAASAHIAAPTEG